MQYAISALSTNPPSIAAAAEEGTGEVCGGRGAEKWIGAVNIMVFFFAPQFTYLHQFFHKPFKFSRNDNVFQTSPSGGYVKEKRKIAFGSLNLQHDPVKPQTKSK